MDAREGWIRVLVRGRCVEEGMGGSGRGWSLGVRWGAGTIMVVKVSSFRFGFWWFGLGEGGFECSYDEWATEREQGMEMEREMASSVISGSGSTLLIGSLYHQSLNSEIVLGLKPVE